jgi:hypothetical protein
VIVVNIQKDTPFTLDGGEKNLAEYTFLPLINPALTLTSKFGTQYERKVV